MNTNECPCCGSENYRYVSGVQGGEPIEPDEGWCDECGFHYRQHVNHSMEEQIKNYVQALIAAEGEKT